MLRSMLILASLVTAICTVNLAMAQSGSRSGEGMLGGGSSSRSYAPVPPQTYGNPSSGSRSYNNQPDGPPVHQSHGYSLGASYGGRCGTSGHATWYYAPLRSDCGAAASGSTMYYSGSPAFSSSCGVGGGQYAPFQAAPMQPAPSQSAPMRQSPAGSGTFNSTYRLEHIAPHLSSRTSDRIIPQNTQIRNAQMQYITQPSP